MQRKQHHEGSAPDFGIHRVTITGTNQKAVERHMFGIDCLMPTTP